MLPEARARRWRTRAGFFSGFVPWLLIASCSGFRAADDIAPLAGAGSGGRASSGGAAANGATAGAGAADSGAAGMSGNDSGPISSACHAPTQPGAGLALAADQSGCACPYSKCLAGGGCAPVCPNTDFSGISSIRLPFSRVDVSDLPLGVSADANSVLYLTSASGCDQNQLVLARRSSASEPFTAIDLTPQLAAIDDALATKLALGQFEVATGLSGDGRSLVIETADMRSFRQLDFDATSGVLSDAGEGWFATLDANLPASTLDLYFPVLSGDGLGFYYRIVASDLKVNGHYEATRRSTSEDFAPGTRLPDSVQSFGRISGVSYDRLMLFTFTTDTYSTTLFTRASSALPFSSPNGEGCLPVSTIGSLVRPTGDCRLLTGCADTTGCARADLCLIGAP